MELKSSGPLYLCPLIKKRDWSKTDIWYSHQPVGINTIDTYKKKIAVQAGLDCTDKRFTNHSVRKTTLKKAGANSREIIAITGHKSEHDQLDLSGHCKLSTMISGNHKAQTDTSTIRE